VRETPKIQYRCCSLLRTTIIQFTSLSFLISPQAILLLSSLIPLLAGFTNTWKGTTHPTLCCETHEDVKIIHYNIPTVQGGNISF